MVFLGRLVKKRNGQQPDKNVLSNVGHKILKELLNEQLYKQGEAEEINGAFQNEYIQSLQKYRTLKYYSIRRLRHLWFEDEVPESILALRRKISYEFITNRLVSWVISSKKMLK